MTNITLEDLRQYIHHELKFLHITTPAFGAWMKLVLLSLPYGGRLSKDEFHLGKYGLELALGAADCDPYAEGNPMREAIEELINFGLIDSFAEDGEGPYRIPFVVDVLDSSKGE